MVKTFPCVFMNVIMCVKFLKTICLHVITQLCLYTCSTLFSFKTTSQTLSKSSPFKKYNNQIIHEKCSSLSCDLMNCSPQVPLSMGFSRQEYWSGCHFLQQVFLTQGLNLGLLHYRQTALSPIYLTKRHV